MIPCTVADSGSQWRRGPVLTGSQAGDSSGTLASALSDRGVASAAIGCRGSSGPRLPLQFHEPNLTVPSNPLATWPLSHAAAQQVLGTHHAHQAKHPGTAAVTATGKREKKARQPTRPRNARVAGPTRM